MNPRVLIIVAASVLAACGEKRTITLTLNENAAKTFRDTNAGKLAMLLKSINHPATVTHEAETLHVRVGAASVSDVRRAVCRQMGWSSYDGKMAQIDNALKSLRVTGITKVKIASDTETLDVELEKDGRCKKAP